MEIWKIIFFGLAPLRKQKRELELIKAQALNIYNPIEVIMIGKDKDFMLAILKVVTPSLESFNNSYELTVVRNKI